MSYSYDSAEYDTLNIVSDLVSTSLFYSSAEGVIVPLEYEFITRTWYNDNDENLIVQKAGKLGTITMQNEVVIPLEYDGLSGWVEYSLDDHYAKLNGKYGMVQPNGEVLIPCIYDFVRYYSRDAILVKKDGLFGILTREGDTVLPIQYENMIDDIDFFHFGGPIDDKIIALQDVSGHTSTKMVR